MSASRQCGRGEGPGAAAVRRRCAELRRSLKNLHRAVRLGSPIQRHLVRADGIADDARRGRSDRVDRHAEGCRCRPGIVFRRQAMGPIRKRCRRIAPRPAAVRRGSPDLVRPIEHFHRAVGRRRAGQRQRIVIGDVVARGAAVGRERRDRKLRIQRRKDAVLRYEAAGAKIDIPLPDDGVIRYISKPVIAFAQIVVGELNASDLAGLRSLFIGVDGVTATDKFIVVNDDVGDGSEVVRYIEGRCLRVLIDDRVVANGYVAKTATMHCDAIVVGIA